MNPILASGGVGPFEHTWDSWVVDFYGWSLDLRSVPGLEVLGITKAVVTMIVAAVLLVLVGTYVGKRARRAQEQGRVTRGFAGCIEVIVEYVRNEMVKPYLPHHYKSPWFISVFCTFFFFILFCNLLGLLPQPFGFTATGTPWVSGGLAWAGTFVIMIAAGIKEHGVIGYTIKHQCPPGVPLWIAPLIWAIEVVGLIVKPFALMVRLAANMTAGHIILAVLMSFLSVGFSTIAINALVWVPSAIGFAAITVFEIVIALIQAYIFTILSCVFIGAAVSHEH